MRRTRAFASERAVPRALTGWVGTAHPQAESWDVPPRARVPEHLKQGPFTLRDALAAGVTRGQLGGKSWVRLRHGFYAWRGLARDPEIALQVAQQRMPPIAAFATIAAAWLHGLDVDLKGEPQMIVPDGHGVSTRAGIAVLRRRLEPDDIVNIRGYRATSVCRTLLDLSWQLSLTEAVVLVDEALHKSLVDVAYLRSWLALRRGSAGTARLRAAVERAEPLSESPMETRLRLLLVRRELPRPQAQVSVADALGFIGRIDLYYPEQRLGLEYDGATHRESLAEDNRRQNRLLRAGVRLLRFTAADIYQRPDEVVALVAAQLRLRPAA